MAANAQTINGQMSFDYDNSGYADDPVTARQLVSIKMLSAELDIDAARECREILNCDLRRLSRKAASAFIAHLRSIQIGLRAQHGCPHSA